MQRPYVFAAILAIGLVAIIASIGTFAPHQMMMSDMMGRGFLGGMNSAWPVVFAVSTTLVLIAVAYVIAFPNIRYTTASKPGKDEDAQATGALGPLDILMRVSKTDERAVLKVLKDGGGVCYQKDITYSTGLSKIKIHRIVARLTERGIIQVKKVGKTNEVRIAEWLKPEAREAKSSQPKAT